MTDPRRVAVATVLEDREPYWTDVRALFLTLERLGGAMAYARRFAYFIESAEPSVAASLEELRVSVAVVPRVHRSVRNANKLAMLRTREECDYLVALDNDIAVTRDFVSEINGSALAARAVFVERLKLTEWMTFFDFFGIDFPQTRYRMISTLDETVSLNTGVLIVPHRLIDPLRAAWRVWLDRVEDAYDVLPALAQYPYSDQFAFALALGAERLPVRELPVSMNYPASGHVHPTLRPSRGPYLLHHHHRIVTGTGLPLSRFPALNRTIRRVNRVLAPGPGS